MWDVVVLDGSHALCASFSHEKQGSSQYVKKVGCHNAKSLLQDV